VKGEDAFTNFLQPASDVWNRQGILVTLQRAKVIEALSGKAFGPGPGRPEDEQAWAQKLTSDPTYQKYNQAIPWNDQRVTSLFEAQAQITMADQR
jgi:hypothetical protein